MSYYTFDSNSLLKDGKPWFPLMGEIHYSRYPKEYWKESLCKMKAGGIDIISTYVIWIHHEEIEGQYDFTGNRNLHEFVDACRQCNVKLLLRIGPWIHGETRNGGFPDWLLKKDFEVRTNDDAYFKTVENWYKKIFDQVDGYLWTEKQQDNPIIGIQIENEFGHCGGLYDESGETHMKKLKEIAENIGFKVPLYTATGWGGARTGGMIPVMGGYCDAPWDPRTTKIEPSGNYVFTYERNDHNIGSDHGLGFGITFDASKFPYLTAELGGGLQVTGHRRTIATSKDIGAMSLVKMGSGVNLLGYYMYHGGTNPYGKLTTLQETKATGYPNDLPELSYDFRAPIREYGQISDTYREIKLLSYFVHSYGEEFCKMPAKIPEQNPLTPSDFESMRYSFRTNGKSGYLFINNYVRLENLSVHKEVIKTDSGIEFPPLSIKDKDFFFLPYNIKYGKSEVEYATVTPFFKADENTFFFYTRDGQEESADFFKFKESCDEDKFVVLSRKDALNTWHTSDGNIFITDEDSYIFTDDAGNNIFVTSSKNEKLCFYSSKELARIPEGFTKTAAENKNINKNGPEYLFIKYELTKTARDMSFVQATETAPANYKLDFSKAVEYMKAGKKSDNLNDCFVKIYYTGNSARLYGQINGKKTLIADNFYLGDDYSWDIGLKRFTDQNIDLSNLELEIKPLVKSNEIFIEKWPELPETGLAEIKNISCDFEFSFKL